MIANCLECEDEFPLHKLCDQCGCCEMCCVCDFTHRVGFDEDELGVDTEPE